MSASRSKPTEKSAGPAGKLDAKPAVAKADVPPTEPREPAVKPAPEHKGFIAAGKVVNAPTSQNNGGFETRVTAPAHAPADKTAGANATMAANLFEQRVTQEQGSH